MEMLSFGDTPGDVHCTIMRRKVRAARHVLLHPHRHVGTAHMQLFPIMALCFLASFRHHKTCPARPTSSNCTVEGCRLHASATPVIHCSNLFGLCHVSA